MGDESAHPRKVVESLIEEEGRGSEFVGENEGADPKLAGLKRATEVDTKNDQTNLERSLSRTLYLLVRPKSQNDDTSSATAWRFPSGDMLEKEGLKEVCWQ